MKFAQGRSLRASKGGNAPARRPRMSTCRAGQKNRGPCGGALPRSGGLTIRKHSRQDLNLIKQLRPSLIASSRFFPIGSTHCGDGAPVGG